MSRLFTIFLPASLGASCGDYGYYGVEFGAPVYETTPAHDDAYYRDQWGWYYGYGDWLWLPAPAPQQRERQQERAPQAPLQPPREVPAPPTDVDGDVDRDAK